MDPKNRANRYSSVQIRRSIDGVTCHSIPRTLVLRKVNRFFLLLGNENGAFAGAAHGRYEEVVSDDIEFLLVVACCVGGASEAGEVYEGSAADVVGYGFEGELEGVAEESGFVISWEWVGGSVERT
jgi:hypothetical protein